MTQTTSEMNDTTTHDKHGDVDQYLSFVLGDEEYGLPILRVQEIRGFAAITPVPKTPDYVKGVMNLRGTVIPVISLRSKLGLQEIEHNRFTVIVVVHVGQKTVGLIVDAVSDVLHVQANDVQPTPRLVSDDTVRFARGIVRSREKLIVLLDLEALFDGNDLGDSLPSAAA